MGPELNGFAPKCFFRVTDYLAEGGYSKGVFNLAKSYQMDLVYSKQGLESVKLGSNNFENIQWADPCRYIADAVRELPVPEFSKGNPLVFTSSNHHTNMYKSEPDIQTSTKTVKPSWGLGLLSKQVKEVHTGTKNVLVGQKAITVGMAAKELGVTKDQEVIANKSPLAHLQVIFAHRYMTAATLSIELFISEADLIKLKTMGMENLASYIETELGGILSDNPNSSVRHFLSKKGELADRFKFARWYHIDKGFPCQGGSENWGFWGEIRKQVQSHGTARINFAKGLKFFREYFPA